jgi:tricarballylate dehydrogenase
MMRVTQGLSDPGLAQILVSQSLPTMQWLRRKGVRFVLSYSRQAFKDAIALVIGAELAPRNRWE